MGTLLGFKLSLVDYKEVKTKLKGIIDILHFGFVFWALTELSAFGTPNPLALLVWDVAPKRMIWILAVKSILEIVHCFFWGMQYQVRVLAGVWAFYPLVDTLQLYGRAW